MELHFDEKLYLRNDFLVGTPDPGKTFEYP